MFTILFVLALAVSVVLGAVTAAETLAVTIAGVAAPILTQLLKRWFDVSGTPAFIITGIVSFAVALAALFFTSQLTNVGDVFKSGMAVLGLATTIYKLFMEKATSA